jgi:hypothetical protein
MLELQEAALICQSCGMPLLRAEDFGTCASGGRINDYCRECYRGGDFTEPQIGKTEMMVRVAKRLMSTRGMPETTAQAVAASVVSTLKRWINSQGLRTQEWDF